MEYLVGSFSTIVLAIVMLFIINKISNKQKQVLSVSYRQSQVFERIKPVLPYVPPTIKDSQSKNHQKSNMIRVAIIGDRAYWIADNRVFSAQIDESGFVEYGSGTPIDTMDMDRVELERLSFIVDRLTEGNDNDSSNTGH